MGEKKVYTYQRLKAWYSKAGRLWVVQENNEVKSFKGVESMLENYPDLIAVPAIEAALTRKQQKRKRFHKKVIIQQKEESVQDATPLKLGELEKLVICYYCSGKGRVSFGIPCPNCGGKGSFIVTSKGI